MLDKKRLTSDASEKCGSFESREKDFSSSWAGIKKILQYLVGNLRASLAHRANLGHCKGLVSLRSLSAAQSYGTLPLILWCSFDLPKNRSNLFVRKPNHNRNTLFRHKFSLISTLFHGWTTSKHGRLKSESTVTWIVSGDRVEER